MTGLGVNVVVVDAQHSDSFQDLFFGRTNAACHNVRVAVLISRFDYSPRAVQHQFISVVFVHQCCRCVFDLETLFLVSGLILFEQFRHEGVASLKEGGFSFIFW